MRIIQSKNTEVLNHRARASISTWLPLALGLLVMYVPSLYDLIKGIWSSDEQMHGPIVLTISLWLIYRNWSAMKRWSFGKNTNAWGWTAIIFSLIIYTIGRSQNIIIFEVGSVIWLLVGVIWLHHGITGLKVQWFGLFFMIFMVPLPSLLVDAVTMPMKLAVSYVVDQILFWMNYPIARTGVILQIGQYSLLVADACAGLHTLLTLEALGLLYLNLVRRDSVVRNMCLAILIIPISFTANVIRVMSLTLITYYFGDEAGQGFLHGFAGMVLFLSALMLIIGVDTVIQTYESLRQRHRLAKSDL
ncbi:MAG: exosortase B [Polaromonas sp.]|nr:exosortase B [Polaromonas sp.]